MKRNLITKKHLKIIIPIIAVVGVAIWFMAWMTSPKQGKVQTPSVTQKTATPVADRTLDGTYVTFTYSGSYSVKSEGPKNNDLEIHTLSAAKNYDKRTIVSVSNLSDGQLGSYGAYIYRKLDTNTYTTRKVTVAGTTVDSWVKKDGSEQTIFLPKGNKIATITFTTASTNEQLTPEVDALLKTFRWK